MKQVIIPEIPKAKIGASQPIDGQYVHNVMSGKKPIVSCETIERYIQKHKWVPDNFNTAVPEGCGQKLKTTV